MSRTATQIRVPRIEPPLAGSEAYARLPFFDPAHWARAATDVWSGSWLDAERIAQRAQERLVALLRFARAQVPLYQRLHRDLPPPSRQKLDELPVLTKAQVMAALPDSLAGRGFSRRQIDAFLADPSRIGTPLGGRYAIWTSSGSTGVPGIFVHDGDALAVYDALELLRFRGLSASPLRAGPFMSSERYAMVAAIDGHFAGIATIERLRRNFPFAAPFVRAFSLLQPLPDLVAALNRYRPTLLATYPTAADLLADEQQAGRLRLALDEIWCGGECLSSATRERVARIFRCRVREAYGASEFMSIAWPCTRGRLHVNADWVLLEGVDAQCRPVAPGVPSHTTLLTNLANRAQPLIRYDLGDSITMLPECPCGSNMPAIEVQGRHDDVLRITRPRAAPVKLMPLALATVLEDDARVNDFQLLQIAPRRLKLRLGKAERPRGAAACAALRTYLHRLELASVRVELDAGAPQRDPVTGKLRRVVNTLPPGENCEAR